MEESNTLKKIFSENLKYWTKTKGKRMSDVSKDLKISFSTVADWYSGKNFPRIEAIQKLANYFGIKKSDLIEKNINTVNIDEAIKMLYVRFNHFKYKLIELEKIDDIELIHFKIKELLEED